MGATCGFTMMHMLYTVRELKGSLGRSPIELGLAVTAACGLGWCGFALLRIPPAPAVNQVGSLLSLTLLAWMYLRCMDNFYWEPIEKAYLVYSAGMGALYGQQWMAEGFKWHL